jgi:hypothetical protein
MGDDTQLAFVHGVLGLESLHFGLFTDGVPHTLDGIRQAQRDYTTELIGLVPEGAKTVLDVGAGLGDTSKRLKEQGLLPEGLSPDTYLGEAFAKTCGPEVPFHNSTFEDFSPGKTYDCLVFSESPQYIDKDAFFPKCTELTEAGGAIALADFFKKTKELGYPNSFVEDDFRARAEKAGFEITHHRDITEEILPSFDVAMSILERGRKLYEYAIARTRKRWPILSRIIRFFLKRKLKRARYLLYEQIPDRIGNKDRFRREMRYAMYSLRRK